MISVCIPVFNADVRQLAGSLMTQAEGIHAEIILIDDRSEPAYREMNRGLQKKGILYRELDENIGRSRIRNLFASHANQPSLLFLDCDSVLVSDAFLQTYADAVREYPGRVICGGRVYDPRPPVRNKRLHWKYGIKRESQPVHVRANDPNRSFMTNNFIVPLEVLRKVPFDERVSGYGHEDSLFGFELARRGIEIRHIDNPVLHGELEPNAIYLEKTREAVRNLASITTMLKDDPAFMESITLLQAARKMESAWYSGILRTVSRLSVPFWDFLLRKGLAGLRLLDAYKLGLYLRFRDRVRSEESGRV